MNLKTTIVIIVICACGACTTKKSVVDQRKTSPRFEQNKSERLTGYFSGVYKFTAREINKNNKVEKTFTREVETFITGISSETTTLVLLCVKYGFDDPEITSFIRKTAYVFDVIQVTIDRNGKIISIKDEDKEKIKTDWKDTKKEILERFSGPAINNYLYNVDYTINNDKLLFKFLETDQMYGMLFNGISLLENSTKNPKRKVKNKGSVKIIELAPSLKIREEKFIYNNDLIIEGQKTVIEETEKRDKNDLIIKGQKMKKRFNLKSNS